MVMAAATVVVERAAEEATAVATAVATAAARAVAGWAAVERAAAVWEEWVA